MPRDSRWATASRAVACSSLTVPAGQTCAGTIQAGETFRRVSSGQWPVCVPCCRWRFDLEPPPAAAPDRPVVDRWRAFGDERGFTRVTGHDFKIAQMAREPGEDG